MKSWWRMSALLVAAALLGALPSVGRAAAADAKAEVAAALFAASATQAAAEHATDATIAAERAQIIALTAKVRSGQAKQASLTAAQEAFVAELAAKDRAYAEAIDAFRGAVTHITETPEGLAALAKFNSGDEAGAIAIIGQLNDARDAALQRATDIQKAVGRRDEAQLALDANARDKVSTATVLGLYERVVSLDPGVYLDWVQLSSLYAGSSRLADARKAADRAVKLASADDERVLALDSLSDVQAAQGDNRAAAATAQASLAIDARLVAATPSDIHLQQIYAIGLSRFGDLSVAAGDLSGARKAYAQSATVIAGAYQADSANSRSQLELVKVVLKLGEVIAEQGDMADAQDDDQLAVSGARALAKAYPDNAEAQYTLGSSLDQLGELLYRQGDLAGARAAFEEREAIDVRLAAADPSDVTRQIQVAIAHGRTALVLAAQNDFPGALAENLAALAVYRRLSSADPNDARLQHDVALALAQSGDLESALGKKAEARASLMESLAILTGLVKADPSNLQIVHQLGVGSRMFADAVASEDPAKAQGLYDLSFKALSGLVKLDPTNASLEIDLCDTLEARGDLKRLQGDAVAARADDQACLAIANRLAIANPANTGPQRDIGIGLTQLAQVGGADKGWPEAAAQWRAMDKQGILTPEDRHYLVEANTHVPPAKAP